MYDCPKYWLEAVNFLDLSLRQAFHFFYFHFIPSFLPSLLPSFFPFFLPFFLPSFLFFFSFFFSAAVMAYSNSQARRLIGATAAGLHHSHSNGRSKQRLQPTPPLKAMPDPWPTEQGQGSNLHLHGLLVGFVSAAPQWELPSILSFVHWSMHLSNSYWVPTLYWAHPYTFLV